VNGDKGGGVKTRVFHPQYTKVGCRKEMATSGGNAEKSRGSCFKKKTASFISLHERSGKNRENSDNWGGVDNRRLNIESGAPE